MKKAMVILLGAMVALCGCAGTGTASVDGNTDPVALKSEKVEESGWNKALSSERENFTVRSVATTYTADGKAAAETKLIYRFDGDKLNFELSSSEGGKATFVAEAYIETSDTACRIWQRTKEAGKWTDWEGDEMEPEVLGGVLGIAGDYGFAKNRFALFSYSDAEGGYTATANGLTTMKTELGTLAENVLEQLGGDAEFTLGKFVIKINGGKQSASIFEIVIQPAVRDAAPEGGAENGDGIPDGGTENGGGAESGNGNGGSESGGGETPDGGTEAPDGGTEAPAAKPARVRLTQLFYDYGTTKVTFPKDLPALGGESSGGESSDGGTSGDGSEGTTDEGSEGGNGAAQEGKGRTLPADDPRAK